MGEVVRPNQSYAYNLALDFDEIGDGPLVLSPDGKYFYVCLTDDWAAGTTTTTKVPVASVLHAAFGSIAPAHCALREVL